MNARLQLNLDIQIQLQPKLQSILLHHLAALAFLALPRRKGLLGVAVAHGDLAALGARVGYGPVHGGGGGADALEGLHGFVTVVGVGVLLFDRGGLLLGLLLGGLLAAAGAARLRARAGLGVGHDSGMGGKFGKAGLEVVRRRVWGGLSVQRRLLKDGMRRGSKQRGGNSDEAKAEGGAGWMATSQWQVQVSNQESLSLHLAVEISEVVTHQEIDVRTKLWPMRAWFACTCPGPSALDGSRPWPWICTWD